MNNDIRIGLVIVCVMTIMQVWWSSHKINELTEKINMLQITAQECQELNEYTKTQFESIDEISNAMDENWEKRKK